MSQKVTVKTQLKEKDVLKKALENMGFELSEAEKLKMYGQSVSVDIKAHKDTAQFKHSFGANSNGYHSIGFTKNLAGVYDIVGDDYWPCMKNDKFKNEVSQEYSKALIENACEEYGYMITDQHFDENGEIHLTVEGY